MHPRLDGVFAATRARLAGIGESTPARCPREGYSSFVATRNSSRSCRVNVSTAVNSPTVFSHFRRSATARISDHLPDGLVLMDLHGVLSRVACERDEILDFLLAASAWAAAYEAR